MKSIAFRLTWVFCALLIFGVAAAAAEGPAAVDTAPSEQQAESPALAEHSELQPHEVGASCEETSKLDEGEQLILMNAENAPQDPIKAQMLCVRCNCTKPGTCSNPPPCTLCLPPQTCKSQCCYTLIGSNLNGVCG